MPPYKGQLGQLASGWPPIHRRNPKPWNAEQSVWAVSVLFLFFILWVGLCVLVMPKESAPLTPEQEALFGELYTLRSGAFVAACDGDEDYWWRAEGNARDMGLWQSRGHMAAEPNLLEEALRTREALRARLGALLTADQTERLDRQQRYLLASPWWC